MSDKTKNNTGANFIAKPTPPEGREVKGGKVVSGDRLVREAKSGKFIISPLRNKE